MPVDPKHPQPAGFRQLFTPANSGEVAKYGNEKLSEVWARLRAEIEALPVEDRAPIQRKLDWLRKLWNMFREHPQGPVVEDAWRELFRILSPSERTDFLYNRLLGPKEKLKIAKDPKELFAVLKKRGKVCCRKARGFIAKYSLVVANRELEVFRSQPESEEQPSEPYKSMQSWRVPGVGFDTRHESIGEAIEKQKKQEQRERGTGHFGRREMRRVKSKRQTRQIQLFERGRGKYKLDKFFQELGLDLSHAEMLNLTLDSRDGGMGVVGKWRQAQFEGWEVEESIRLLKTVHQGKNCPCEHDCEYGDPWVLMPQVDDTGQITLVEAPPELLKESDTPKKITPVNPADCPF